MPFCCICGCEMRASRRQHHHLAAAPGIQSEFAAAAQAPPTTAKEAPEEAIDGPAPSSIAARIAALRAGAAKRSPNARAPRFGLLLPFVTAESTAIGAAAAAGRALALSTAPSADAASEARVDFAPPPVAPAQPAADTATPGDDGPAVGAVDADSAAADTFSARASADAAIEGTADDTACDAPAPSLACWHVAACEVRENVFSMLQACSLCRCCHCGLIMVPDPFEQGAGWLCQDRVVCRYYYQASDMRQAAHREQLSDLEWVRKLASEPAVDRVETPGALLSDTSEQGEDHLVRAAFTREPHSLSVHSLQRGQTRSTGQPVQRRGSADELHSGVRDCLCTWPGNRREKGVYLASLHAHCCLPTLWQIWSSVCFWREFACQRGVAAYMLMNKALLNVRVHHVHRFRRCSVWACCATCCACTIAKSGSSIWSWRSAIPFAG